MDYNYLTKKLLTNAELKEYIQEILKENISNSKDNIYSNKDYLNENLEFMDKGVFWLVRDSNGKERPVILKYSSESLEEIFDKHKHSYETIWGTFDKTITQNKPYDYFPRGRYVIKNGNKVIINCSSFFSDEKYKIMITSALALQEGRDGITLIKFVFNNNLRYKYVIDK